MIGNKVLGMTIQIEFQNPPRIPSQETPVQAEVHAATHGSTVTLTGNAKMLPSRISSMDLNDVTSMMYSGIKKNSDAESKKA